MPRRLVDEFQAELQHRGITLPGSLSVGSFLAELLWKPNGGGSLRDLVARCALEPAFVLDGHSRWLVFARIVGEIRFYAAPIPGGAHSWWWSGEDPARVAAIIAEPNAHEIGILETIADAVRFSAAYLGGTPLRDIPILRIQTTRARYESRVR